MEVLDPIELVTGLARVEIKSACRAEIVSALDGLRRVRARADAAEVALGLRLRDVSPNADADVSGAARRPARHGDRVRERGDAAAAMPVLGELLGSGEVSGEHVDAVSRALRAAPAGVRLALREAVEEILARAVASGSSPEELSSRLAEEAVRLEADDGVARLERQRRATRLRTWTDKRDGMFRISGAFDPLTGQVLHGRFQAAMAAMFAGRMIPALAPDDPGERQDFLRGLAFIALTGGRKNAKGANPHTCTANANVYAANGLDGNDPDRGPDRGPDGGDPHDGDPHDGTPSGAVGNADLDWAPFANDGPPRFGRTEMVVVVDTRSLDENGRPKVDWGLPIRAPFQAVQDLARNAAIHVVAIDGRGNIVSAPGELNLGRKTRLANKAQRRALRSLYATCAVPGCCVAYEFAKLHHVKWWRHGGLTDLRNLIPLCHRHHDQVHTGGWVLELAKSRALTIRLPNGTTMSTGPPNRAMR
jgi:Domain of unknown function (DUF222)